MPRPPGPAPARDGRRRLPSALASEVLRRHWLVSALLAAGLALRLLTQVAYHPALIYVDSLKYLYGVYPGADPLGYTVAAAADPAGR